LQSKLFGGVPFVFAVARQFFGDAENERNGSASIDWVLRINSIEAGCWPHFLWSSRSSFFDTALTFLWGVQLGITADRLSCRFLFGEVNAQVRKTAVASNIFQSSAGADLSTYPGVVTEHDGLETHPDLTVGGFQNNRFFFISVRFA
jgi:hypothetical protein